ncbi:hypothetical protein A2625_01360 [candidate division WOR-1 bacterium RIFCSPHIGHO2_01_FULL_53_15]|uniref:Lipid II flippase Amj n=1 Tax=candidate division WOR-1 bacterium RIFCSPHIGHO2_01_FULL_53_15 TaxID=1802564 RepID=A0A1F4Q0K5_UNCSA|nr:MAG: hypothetical protein A2625_01360 [candidate division WOR-1 bacterium RIFCSPHIGHO2_01_FULL_53_15]OGC13019.1 MAG: hypothetical protein A3D23_04065 [candidate division WOR-1 bacterium RIFCSPHIGHO2_02_FULL_53_26]
MNPIIFVCILTGIIHFTETAATSLRLAGVRTKQIATSLSFVNATLLITRTSNMLQAPFLGGMVDHAILSGNTDSLVGSFRLVIFSAFIGNCFGAIFTPFFVAIFTKAIERFERGGSVPRLIAAAFLPRNARGIFRRLRLPSRESLMNLSFKGMPQTFLWINLVVVSIYTIGVLSSLYAGALVPEFRITASQLSAIVNGIATILLVTLVDPTCAFITDQAIRGRRKESDVRAMVFYIIIGRIVGTLILAQFLFLPSAEYIRSATLLVKSMFGQ